MDIIVGENDIAALQEYIKEWSQIGHNLNATLAQERFTEIVKSISISGISSAFDQSTLNNIIPDFSSMTAQIAEIVEQYIDA